MSLARHRISPPAPPPSSTHPITDPPTGGTRMSTEDNKAVVARWFAEFWGPDYNPGVIDELAAPDIRFEYSMHAPLRGREQVREFAGAFRGAFPALGFEGTAELTAEGDYVVGQWKGGGTPTGAAFDDAPARSPPGPAGAWNSPA